MAGLGVPVKLLHESLGHIITVELKTGQLYRGKLAEGPSDPVFPKPRPVWLIPLLVLFLGGRSRR